MRLLMIVSAVVFLSSNATEVQAAPLHFNGRTSADAQLYRRSYDTDAPLTRRASRGYCPRSASLLGAVDADLIHTSKKGWTFPFLLGGNCPISAGILKYPVDSSRFGTLGF
jgi:hypothetical protein